MGVNGPDVTKHKSACATPPGAYNLDVNRGRWPLLGSKEKVKWLSADSSPMKKYFALMATTLVFAPPVVLLAGSVAGQAMPPKKTGGYSSTASSPTDVDGITWVISSGDVDTIRVSFVDDLPCGSRFFVQVRDSGTQIGFGSNDPVEVGGSPCASGDADNPQGG